MAGTFDMMRANDLIFNYVVSNWLLGQDPPAFDILAWNNDSTKMPGTMHAFYLRNFYVRNLLAQGQLEIAGQTIDLSSIKSNAYVVSAKNDHIVPWQSAYKTTQLFSGTTRFVLSNGGHIAGIVNPPGPKSWFLSTDDNPARPTTGCRPPSARPNRGGSTGPHGPASKPVRWSSRPRSAAASTRRSATGPASTCSTDRAEGQPTRPVESRTLSCAGMEIGASAQGSRRIGDRVTEPCRWTSVTRGPTATGSSSASMGSDLPRVRADSRAWAIIFGGTRTTFCPADSRSRSSRADRLRQSSIPHSSSPPNSVAGPHQRLGDALGGGRDHLLAEFAARPRRPRRTCGCACAHRRQQQPWWLPPSLERGDDGWAGRRTHLSRGDATLLSSHAGRSFPPDAGTTLERQPEGGSAARARHQVRRNPTTAKRHRPASH